MTNEEIVERSLSAINNYPIRGISTDIFREVLEPFNRLIKNVERKLKKRDIDMLYYRWEVDGEIRSLNWTKEADHIQYFQESTGSYKNLSDCSAAIRLEAREHFVDFLESSL